jgi:hypothetical protein
MSVLAPAQQRYLAPAGYNPRFDPDFVDAVVGHLLRSQGQWCRLGRVFSADVWSVRDAVMVARRLGLNVLGDRHLGYRIPLEAPFQRPRYVHLRSAAAWPPEDSPADAPGQLTLIDDEAIE